MYVLEVVASWRRRAGRTQRWCGNSGCLRTANKPVKVQRFVLTQTYMKIIVEKTVSRGHNGVHEELEWHAIGLGSSLTEHGQGIRQGVRQIREGIEASLAIERSDSMSLRLCSTHESMNGRNVGAPSSDT